MAKRILDSTPKRPEALRAPIVSEHAVWVDVGGGAQMSAPNGDIEWQLRYGDAEAVRFTAASLIASYEYLINWCTLDEARRRIKLMREAGRDALRGEG